MRSICYLWPEGKTKALTFSYDDGQIFDERLIEIFNRYGMKGSFHLNFARLPSPEKTAARYAGHEISLHSLNHPFLERQPREQALFELIEDRRGLESIAGYPVIGMSYPFGTHSAAVREALRAAGVVYSRTTASTFGFNPPEDFLQWDPTCHHGAAQLNELAERFLNMWYPLALFYVWGHSFEFDRQGNWPLIEDFCAKMSGKTDVWYATNIEIYRYLTAVRSLVFGIDRQMVVNPTATDCFLKVDDAVVKVPAGVSMAL